MSTAKFNTWLNPDGTENYKCRAWVNFNGTGTVALRASGNVASITDNGVGDYTVNFTTALSDANYAADGVSGRDSTNALIMVSGYPAAGGGFSSGSYRFYTVASNGFSSGSGIGGNNLDAPFVSVSIFR